MKITISDLFGGTGSTHTFELTPELILKTQEYIEKNALRFQYKNLSEGVEKLCEDIASGRQNSTLADIMTVEMDDGNEIKILMSEL
jgi:poly(3-hydroxyalkanoate) synthetase